MKKFTITLIAALTAAAHAGPPLPAIPMISAPLAPVMRPAPLADTIDAYETPGCWRLRRVAAAMQMGEMAVSEVAIQATGCSASQAATMMLQLAAEGVVVKSGRDWKLRGAK